MDRQIPIYFDSVVVTSPFQEISATDHNIGRIKVRVFTKYANRNGSYITDEVADQLIASATNGSTPVVGFFDPETQTWASHTGPTLANSYGYVEDFVGWEPFVDADGVTRDYAVFSVILFTDYFEEAKKILGQNQSMELDVNSITGDWAQINDEWYYVYTTARMLGFCVIGSHEPCFSVSAFFSKQDANYTSQYEKFSSLLSDLKARVEENTKGGEQPMDNFENQEITPVEETTEPVAVDSPVEENVAEFEQAQVEEAQAVVDEEPVTSVTIDAATITITPEVVEFEEAPVEEPAPVEENKTAELEQQLFAANERIAELEAAIAESQKTIESLNEIKAEFEAIKAAEYLAKKTELVDKYEKFLTEEEIAQYKGALDDFSYEELESKLAVTFANQAMAKGEQVEENKVPLLEPEISQFALLMKKYRKH